MNKAKLLKLAIANSLGVVIYITLIALIMNNGNKIFGSSDNNLIAPILFLLLFVFSALLTGFLVLGKPLMLYIDGQKKDGVNLLFYTGTALFILLILVAILLIILK